MIVIPEKQRKEFDRATALAIQKETFTPSELASELEISEFIASIMVGYMEKAGLVTKGKGNDVRRAKITEAEWDALDRKVENYTPEPEPIPEQTASEPEPLPTVTVTDILSEPIELFKKTLSAEDNYLIITDKSTRVAIPLEDVEYIHYRRDRLFRKGSITLSADRERPEKPKLRADSICFGKKDRYAVYELAKKLAERLEIELIEY